MYLSFPICAFFKRVNMTEAVCIGSTSPPLNITCPRAQQVICPVIATPCCRIKSKTNIVQDQ